jgi:hypothetical protein
MRQFIGAIFLTVLVAGPGGPARAEDANDAKAILDKAIKALGGEEKLSTVHAASWKSKGKITFGGMDSDFTMEVTVQGLDHLRQVFEGEFGGNKVKGILVLKGDKGWRKFGDQGMELDKDGLANEKRNLYLTVCAALPLPLGGKQFKVETAGEEKVGDKPAVAIKVTGPDGKDFKVFYDKESGLPVKQVAKVIGFMGDEFTQETTFDAYKDFDGIKKATKIVAKRDGEKFIEQEITELKVLDKVDAKTFDEPQ